MTAGCVEEKTDLIDCRDDFSFCQDMLDLDLGTVAETNAFDLASSRFYEEFAYDGLLPYLSSLELPFVSRCP